MRASARLRTIIPRDAPTSDDDTSPVTSPKVPYRNRNTKEICEVCGGESLGLRYGANVCNACGQFYLKCSSKADVPPCDSGEQCKVTFKTRTGCRYCRYQKCIAVGMSLEADIAQIRKRKHSEIDSPGPEWDLYPAEDSNESSDVVEAAEEPEEDVCAVCGGESVGIRYGAKSCNACADFFFKFGRNPDPRRYPKNCVVNRGTCVIKFENRAICPYCRIKKCLAVGMSPKTQVVPMVIKTPRVSVSAPPEKDDHYCAICGDEAIGVRYGVRACRPCEEFYHRIIYKDAAAIMATLECSKDGHCYINSTNRSDCRYCRFKKCVEAGMNSLSAPNAQFLRYFENKGGLNYEVPINIDNDIPLYYNVETPIVPQESSGDVCVVCGAASIGRRWGVEACDPCAQFFYINYGSRDSVRCKHGQTCVITRENRFQCRFCRIQKCIAVGMDASGFGTRSLSQKRQKVEGTGGFETVLARMGAEGTWGNNEDSNLSVGDLSVGDSSASSSSNSMENSGSLNFTNTLVGFQYEPAQMKNSKLDIIVRLHKETCAFTLDKIQNILDRPMDFVNISTTTPVEPWQFFAPQMDLEIRQILHFVDNIDNVTTDKTSIFKIYMLRIARALSPEGLFLQDGRFLDFPVISFLFGEPIAAEMMQISVSVRALSLSDEGLALFIVLVLLESQNHTGQTLATEILSSLKTIVPNFHSLMELIPKLDRINSNFQSYIIPWLQVNHESLQLPQVFSEVLNIPHRCAL